MPHEQLYSACTVNFAYVSRFLISPLPSAKMGSATSDNSHYSIFKDLLQSFYQLQASQKRPKFNIHFNHLIRLFECSTSGGQSQPADLACVKI